ncbi:MAG: CerR family C-terminal domain-containing protein [Deltaproteobacteria bacterium]|nr:CerR family C-terminal domain-containing protein [Deltaproteobacteria bacterium]
MAQRKDGQKTRSKLLDVACEMFSEKGFGDTKVAEICRRAGTNVASVNYYFGDKTALYFEAWQEAFRRDTLPDPLPQEDRAPEERFRRRIHTMVHRFCDAGKKGQFIRMYLMELTHPVALNHEKWRKLFEPRHLHLLQLIRDVAGPETTEEDVRFCELSVINLCRGFLILNPSDVEFMLQQPMNNVLIDKMADHITRFSLAGIHAMRGEVPAQKT